MGTHQDFLDAIERRVEKGLVRKATFGNLTIYNYTPECQFSKAWDDITLQCRGLIVDDKGDLVARPLGKFFNTDEMPQTAIGALVNHIGSNDIEISVKMDGSLGIGYLHEGQVKISTRGSLNSEQAIEATKIAHVKYKDAFEKFFKDYKGHTPLFEILYPENRIVVNYGNTRDIVLIGIVHNISGKEFSYEETCKIGKECGFNCVEYWPHKQFTDALNLIKGNEKNSEGFVLRFPDGLRIKMKYSEYLKLHRIVTGLTKKSIWRYLSTNNSIKQLTESVPEEFQKYINEVCTELRTKFKIIEDEARAIVNKIPIHASKKEKALAIQASSFYLKSVCFSIINNKDYSYSIWRYIEPKGAEKRESEDI